MTFDNIWFLAFILSQIINHVFGVLIIRNLLNRDVGMPRMENPPPPPPKRKIKARLEELAKELGKEGFQPVEKLDTSNPPTGCHQPTIDTTKKPPKPPSPPKGRVLKYY